MKKLESFSTGELFKVQKVFHEKFVACYGELYPMEYFNDLVEDLEYSDIVVSTSKKFNKNDDYYYFNLDENIASLNEQSLCKFIEDHLFENIDDLSHDQKNEFLKELKQIDQKLHDQFIKVL